ncbi:MAG: hypothetical protein H6809_04945 [Phycisphaeraceae bacterium]|nr:hypothetical protein [Phycisphaeraceae bacterium]
MRLVAGVGVVAVLSIVAAVARPSGSRAAEAGAGSAGVAAGGGSVGAGEFRHTAPFGLESGSSGTIDGGGLAGHSGIPEPLPYDEAGRANLGIVVGPALFVWVYGGEDGVRYTIADVRGQVLASGLTANEVYGAFPEINIPEMQFGPDGALCEPLMWAGDGM